MSGPPAPISHGYIPPASMNNTNNDGVSSNHNGGGRGNKPAPFAPPPAGGSGGPIGYATGPIPTDFGGNNPAPQQGGNGPYSTAPPPPGYHEAVHSGPTSPSNPRSPTYGAPAGGFPAPAGGGTGGAPPPPSYHHFVKSSVPNSPSGSVPTSPRDHNNQQQQQQQGPYGSGEGTLSPTNPKSPTGGAPPGYNSRYRRDPYSPTGVVYQDEAFPGTSQAAPQ